MSTTAVVSTSINAHPDAYERWAQVGHLIVAGDTNSPKELEHYVKDLGGLYLTPETQDKRYPFSQHIGWRNIQRRNAAIMAAYEMKYNYVVTVDDDNAPVGTPREWALGHIAELEVTETPIVYGSPTGFLNTGIFCTPAFHQRGTPYGVVTHVTQPVTMKNPRVVVSQAQVLGDPDCDAVDRICNAPEVHAVIADAVIDPGTYAAFNSQATMWAGEWAPVMAVLPGIGRYDDIFASFIFHRMALTYNVALHVGTPCVVQKRNAHDLVKDLKAELWGMNWVIAFVNDLRQAFISGDMPLHVAYSELIVAAENILPEQTILFARSWIKYWESML